ncbi:MAG: MarR family transcriptional regulator [Anaerovoracaceae bacterium]|nr:MarR family transcriptional regulator [Bacillota bacterium]MDD7734879.1 MarR family transcriptional regulator [Bacillota bacterium]MDY5905508.1 MarR family transcriptional regulator [Anaerovoracaceae bacterium]
MYNNTGNVRYLSVFSDMMKKYQESCRSSLDGYRFTPNETAMMIYMLKHPEIDTAKDIARNLGISQSLICRSVDSLTRKGLIDVVKDSEDRRVNHLTLNIKEKSLKNTLLSMDPDFEKQMTEGVAADDLAVFQRVISRMAANVGAV